MLSALKEIRQDIELLKYGSGADEVSEAWTYVVNWHFTMYPYRNYTDEEFNKLPAEHPAYSLGPFMWPQLFLGKFLTCECGYNRIEITLQTLFEYWIEEAKMSYYDLLNNMTGCMNDVNELMNNQEWWKPYYEEQAKAREEQELKFRYRREYHDKIISAEGEEWLRENDQDFWENEMNKLSDPQEYQKLTAAIRQVMNEPKETPEERQERLFNLAESKGLLPPVEQPKSRQQEIEEWLQQKHNDNLDSKLPIKVYYQGRLPEGSIEIVIADGRRVPVFPNVIYTISAQVYENLQQPQSQFRVGDWVRINE